MTRVEFEKKIKFVSNLEKAILPIQSNLTSIRYEVYESVAGYVQEYLVVDYVGGAKTVRNCSCNSCSAILEELVKYLNHCYYAELDYYNEIINSSDWQLIV